MANEAEQAIYQRLASAPLFHPASVELLPEDWGIETGDVVSVKSGDETYNVPVYSHTLVWNGKSKATIESTGNQEREPLPELKRKEYQQGHATYTGFKANKQEIDDHWQHVTQVTDKGMSDSFGIIGVKIGADGMPMKDASGNYIWDDTGTGGEIWGHLNRSAWTNVIQNHIQDANGRILSIGQVLTSADGQALITAINDQQTGTAAINANRIKLNATDTITLDAKLGILANGRLRVSGSLDVEDHVFVGDNLYVGEDLVLNDGYTITFSGQYDDLTFYPRTARFGNFAVTKQILAHDDLKVGLDAVVNGGQIEIKFADNSDGTHNSANFNIAATQYYIDGVAAAYANAVNRVVWPITPRTQASFSVSVPSNPWNASTETGTTASRIFSLSAGNFDSNYISTVDLTMSHNENGQAVTDGVVAKIDVDASDVYLVGERTGRNSVTISNSDIVREIQDLYNATTHNTTIYIEATASNGAQGTQSFTVSGADAYNDGVRDGGGTAVASSELLVRQDDGQGGQIETQLIDGSQTVNLIAGELCEIDLRYNGNYIKWGFVQAPSLSIGTPFINNPQAGYIRPAVTIDGHTYYGETIKLTNQRIADWGGPIT